MLTVGMNYQVRPGKEQAFEEMFAAVLRLMERMAGHRTSKLFRNVQEPDQYLIVSDWTDRAAFDGFIRSAEFAKVANWGKQEVLAGRPQHQYFES